MAVAMRWRRWLVVSPPGAEWLRPAKKSLRRGAWVLRMSLAGLPSHSP